MQAAGTRTSDAIRIGDSTVPCPFARNTKLGIASPPRGHGGDHPDLGTLALLRYHDHNIEHVLHVRDATAFPPVCIIAEHAKVLLLAGGKF